MDKAPRLSIRAVVLILPSNTPFCDDLFSFSSDQTNRETAMLVTSIDNKYARKDSVSLWDACLSYKKKLVLKKDGGGESLSGRLMIGLSAYIEVFTSSNQDSIHL